MFNLVKHYSLYMLQGLYLFIKKHKIFNIFILFFCFLFSSPINSSQPFPASLLKAVYTYKFAKFTYWPEQDLIKNDQFITLCIIGKSPFSNKELALIDNKPIKKRTLKTIQLNAEHLTAEDLTDCQIAYISVSEKNQLSNLFEILKSFPILTVSDISRFSELGGMITLIQLGSKIIIQINQEVVENSGLKISSKLLEFSILVGKDE